MIEAAVVIILALFLNLLSVAVIRSRRVHSLLSFSIFFAQLQWYTIPTTLSIGVPSVLDNGWAARISREDYYRSLSLELLVAIAALGLFLFVLRTKRSIHASNADSKKVHLPHAFVFSALAAAVCGTQVLSTGFDYLKNNVARAYGDEFGLVDAILGPLASFSMAYLILVYFYHEDRHLRFFAWFSLATLGVARFFAGSRIFIILPVFAYLMGSWRRIIDRPGRAVALGAIGLIGAIAALPLVIAMGEVRQSGETLTLSSISTSAGEIVSVGASAVFGKYDGASTGELLVSSHGAGTAGFTPYIGSLLVFIPRALVPSRPVPGSYDGTSAGHPTRLVPSFIYYDSPSYNVGILPGHIAVWQLGYFGPFINVIAIAAYLLFLNSYLASGNLWKLIMALHALSVPSFHTVFTSADVVLRNVVTILFAMSLLAGLRLLLRRRRPRKRPDLMAHQR